MSPELIEKIHKSFLHLLISLMETAQINLEYSRSATRDFLNLFPTPSFDQLNVKIKKYTETHPEFKNIYIEFLKLQENTQTEDVLSKMRSFMKTNQLDKAVRITQ